MVTLCNWMCFIVFYCVLLLPPDEMHMPNTILIGWNLPKCPTLQFGKKQLVGIILWDCHGFMVFLSVQTSGTARPIVRKKAALCLLRLLRKTPVDQMLINADTFSPIMIGLLEDRDLGVLLGSVTLLLGICTRTGSSKCPCMSCLGGIVAYTFCGSSVRPA